MARTVRLLHLSDLHITSGSLWGQTLLERLNVLNPAVFYDRRSRPADRALLVAVARTASELEADVVVITGDLANRGDANSLSSAFGFVDHPVSEKYMDHLAQPTLRGYGCPIWLLPGNHDRYDQFAGAVGAGGREFDTVFSKFWNVGQGACSFTLGGDFGIVLGDLTLSRIADAKGALSSLGQGRAYPERIWAMEAATLLLRARHPEIAVVWAVHFAPAFTGLDSKLRLLEDDRLLEAAAQLGIRHILCGHTHEPRFYCPVAWPIEILCTGSAAQRGDHPNTIHLVEIEVSKGTVQRFEPQELHPYAPESLFRPTL